MLNNKNNESIETLPAVTAAIKAHSLAAKSLEEAARRVKLNPVGHMAEIYSIQLDQAMEAFEVACDDLREIRDGYRYTVPHAASFKSAGRG